MKQYINTAQAQTGLRWAEGALRATLFLLFFLPALVFVPGKFQESWIFVNYREPKLAAVQILAWLFLTIFWWTVWTEPERPRRLKAVIRDPWVWLLGVFILFLGFTARHALVREAAFYELAQYFTLLNLYIALVVLWQEKRLFHTALAALALSFVVITAIGLFQLWKPIPFLIPIHTKSLLAPNPSTMGYKNPAALAVLGQLFLGAALVAGWFQKRKRRLAGAAGLILLAEVGYLATLQSRTSYFSFTVALIFLFICIMFHYARRRKFKVLKIAGAAILGATIMFGGILGTYPPAKKRVQMTVQYFKEPAKFFGSDRGTYLRNSIFMARKNLLGVGIGNWGFAYPVYRHFQPQKLFTKRVQVMRAHNDYAQLLGETGFGGLALWVVLLCWAFARGARTAWQSEEPWPMFVVAQYLAFLLVMIFDYCIEMPYHKFAFFSVLAMIGAMHRGAVRSKQ